MGQPWTGQTGPDSRERIAWSGQPGQVSLGGLARKVSRIMSAWTRQRKVDSKDRAGTGQPGQDYCGRTASTEQLGHDNKDSTAGAG
jgi:hypothetical protein